MNYFRDCGSVQELKKEYRSLAMLNHPDMGGDTATMAAINSEYKRMLEIFECGGNKHAESSADSKTQDKHYKQAPKKQREKSYYSGSAIKDFTDRYTMQGGIVFRMDKETCIFYGSGLKTVIVKEVNHPRLGKVYTTRFYNNMPKKYADILGVSAKV